eukprot:TRINITY_DN9760_c0_g1_i2.p1 TRINITY_DN9760_c0_g1~~TRINITY_DN9760_c0_g1_i2.p1  ORF type:complete len:239 (+),score=27.24 TRINITY_DN9760_c0_g1_i2:17-733(+)
MMYGIYFLLVLPVFGQLARGTNYVELLPLPYSYDALEPHIDEATMRLHHDKHHAAYVQKLNEAVSALGQLPLRPAVPLPTDPVDLARQLNTVSASLQSGAVDPFLVQQLVNNLGGHVNHAFFWPLLSTTGSTPLLPDAPLRAAIEVQFHSMETFVEKFTQTATRLFGSGWAWLAVDPKTAHLVITATKDQATPLSHGLEPVVGLDLWEHAYYLKYQNRRAGDIFPFFRGLKLQQANAN